MSRRRSTKIRTCQKLYRSGQKWLEHLEARRLLTTIITDTDPLTATPETVFLEYKDARDTPVRIVVSGDISAEFIFARVTEGDDDTGFGGNKVILGEPVAASNEDEDGRDLFHIFVAQASIDSFISVAEFQDDGARPMTPFSGSVPLVIEPTRGSEITKSTAGGSGNIILGARTRDTAAEIDDEEDHPLVSVNNFGGHGLLAPNASGRLSAGLTTGTAVSLGRFLFGGAVFGVVNIQGSMESFYAGHLLTGASQGQIEGPPLVPGNFFVGGDIRNILSKGSIGSDGVGTSDVNSRVQPEYVTGVDFDIRGRVGQIRTNADYLGFAKISNTTPGPGLRIRQQEIEIQAHKTANRGRFTEFENGLFGDRETFFNNNTFETAQFLGSFNSKLLGDNSVHVNGQLQAFVDFDDVADYYAVPLMAGQQVVVRLMEETRQVNVGVFDPDNRLVATDFTPGAIDLVTTGADPTANVDPAQHQEFLFTAEKPGIYRFAVAYDAPGFGTTADRLGLFPYQLRITGVGNLGLGGLVATETISSPATISGGIFTPTTPQPDLSLANVQVVRGDLGAVYSVSDNIVSLAGLGINALAHGGDLRAFDANSIGAVTGSASQPGPGEPDTLTLGSTGARLLALTGSVGMIRARGTDRGSAICIINEDSQLLGMPNIGGDIQYIVAPNTFASDLAANGSIGVVQVAQWGLSILPPGTLSANADAIGKPGVIDLIDVTLDMGRLNTGGPVISTGPGGNVRYIHIAPGSTAYRPILFGGSQPEETFYLPGQEARITEDSGAQIIITPTLEEVVDPVTQQPILDPVTLEPLRNDGSLTVLTYPIARGPTNAGAAGVVILRATSTRGMRVRTSGGSTEIGEILSTGSAAALVRDLGADGLPNTGDEDLGPDGLANTGDDPFGVDPRSTNDNSVDLRSDGPRSLIDVYMIRGNNFGNLRNRTPGELVNINVGQVGRLEAENIGWARTSIRPGMVTEGFTVADNPGTAENEGNTFPFLQAKNAIIINGGAQTNFAVDQILARQAVGNLMIVGVVDEIVANCDNAGIKGVIEGITGAVYVKGQLRTIQVGEGLMPSGTGNMGKAGIYAIADRDAAVSNPGIGRIERVVNQGPGSDLRGTIASNTGIGRIEVSNGSIINSTYGVFSAVQQPTGVRTGADLAASSAFSGTTVIVQGTDIIGNVLGNVDLISVVGDGGIIGLLTRSNNLGPVVSTGGFGIINSDFLVLGNGRFDDMVADGYGIRGGFWRGGQSLDSITVNGNGERLKTTAFSPGVRLSESVTFDPFFGTRPNTVTDLHVVLGTTKASPQRKGTSASGSIDLTTIQVSRDVGSIRANTIRAAAFNVANNIGLIETRDYIDTFELTTGRIDTLSIGKDAVRVNVAAAGPIGAVSIGGSFRGSSQLFATGQNGTIGRFVTNNTLYGNVYGAAGIGSIRVGTFYGSQGTYTPKNLGEFIVGADVLTGSILKVGGRLSKLVIGGNFQDGAQIFVGTLGTKTVIGADEGVIDPKPW